MNFVPLALSRFPSLFSLSLSLSLSLLPSSHSLTHLPTHFLSFSLSLLVSFSPLSESLCKPVSNFRSESSFPCAKVDARMGFWKKTFYISLFLFLFIVLSEVKIGAQN